MVIVTDQRLSQLGASSKPIDVSDAALDRFRNYLCLIASCELSPHVRRKVEPSDIVQQTLLEAHEKREQFRGQSENELGNWLRQMLLNNVADAARALRRQKRDIRKETFANSRSGNQSTRRLAEWLVADQTSPSQRVASMEQVLRMSEAIANLHADQREAIILHHLQGRTLDEIATLMDRSQAAVAGLLHRGLKKLRATMAQEA